MNKGIDNILDKYWNGESTLQEEAQLRAYFNSDEVAEEHRELSPLFQYFEAEATKTYDFEPDLSFTKSSGSKIRFLIPKIIAIAASLVLLFTVSKQWVSSAEDTVYKNKYTELQDPQEALDITLDALGFVSHKIDKGTQELSHIKEIEKTAVFKFDK